MLTCRLCDVLKPRLCHTTIVQSMYVSHIIKPNIISYHYSLLNDSTNQFRLKCHHSRLNLNFFQQLKIFLEAILTFVIWENFVSSKVIFRRWFWQMWFGKSLDLANFFWPFVLTASSGPVAKSSSSLDIDVTSFP
jgi:hypothetical protein